MFRVGFLVLFWPDTRYWAADAELDSRCQALGAQRTEYISAASSTSLAIVHFKYTYALTATMIARLLQTTIALALAFLVVDRLPPAAADDGFAKSTRLSALKATNQDPRTTTRPQTAHELLRRQSQSVVAYVAPDYTVGFVDGRIGTVLLSSSRVRRTQSLQVLLFSAGAVRALRRPVLSEAAMPATTAHTRVSASTMPHTPPLQHVPMGVR